MQMSTFRIFWLKCHTIISVHLFSLFK